MTDDKLLKTKQEKKNPKFIRADAHKKGRLGTAWRKPKGYQNKMRLHKKGYRVTVKPGYGTPAELRQTNSEGKAIVQVNNMNELKSLHPKKDAALLGKVGRKNKEELITFAKENKITLVNLSIKRYQEKTEALNTTREEIKKERTQKLAEAEKNKKAVKDAEAKKEAKAAEAKKNSEAKKENAGDTDTTSTNSQHELNEEDKKKAEKKEQDKVLTSKKGI